MYNYMRKSIFLIKSFMPREGLFERKNGRFHCLHFEKMLHVRVQENLTDLKKEKILIVSFENTLCSSFLESIKHLQKKPTMQLEVKQFEVKHAFRKKRLLSRPCRKKLQSNEVFPLS